MKPAIVALALLTLACTTTPSDDAAPAGACRTEGLQSLIGQEATSELGAQAMRISGARALRWIRPGDAVTMDYSPTRLNVNLDAAGRVERFACG